MASWVTPATPSSALGTSTPCQCTLTPSSTLSLCTRTSTRSPSVASISGPGDLPLNMYPSTSRPDASVTVPCDAVRSTVTSAGRSVSSTRSATLAIPAIPDMSWPDARPMVSGPPPRSTYPMSMIEYDPGMRLSCHIQASGTTMASAATVAMMVRRWARTYAVGPCGRACCGASWLTQPRWC